MIVLEALFKVCATAPICVCIFFTLSIISCSPGIPGAAAAATLPSNPSVDIPS